MINNRTDKIKPSERIIALTFSMQLSRREIMSFLSKGIINDIFRQIPIASNVVKSQRDKTYIE